MRLQVRSSDGKAVFYRRKDDGKITRLVTGTTALSLTSGNWYTAKVVVDDGPNDANLQRLRFWVVDDGADISDPAGLLGLYGTICE